MADLVGIPGSSRPVAELSPVRQKTDAAPVVGFPLTFPIVLGGTERPRVLRRTAELRTVKP